MIKFYKGAVMKREVTLFINSLTSGGAERILAIVATELVAQKIKVNLLCIEKDSVYELPKEIEITYLSNLSKHDSNLKKFLYLPLLALRLKRYIKRNQTPLIQSHIYRANFTNLLAKLFGAKHQVQVVEVTNIGNLKDGGFAKKVNFYLIKLLYRYANKVIFISQKMREEFLKNFPYVDNYCVINNPHDIEKIEQLSQEKIEDFTFLKNKKYLITVGRLSPEKRLHSVIDTLKELDEEVELLILGDGVEEQSLKSYTKEQNLQRRVHFLGRVDNPFKYIKASDIFILASEGEGFPNVIIESMVCGTPVISTDCLTGPREILAPSSDINFQLREGIEVAKYGILYPIDNTNTLIDAINLLLLENELYSIYQKNGQIEAQRYSVKNIINQYKEALCVD